MTLKANADKSEVQRIRTGIRAILMLQPLLGISWLFGIFSVNEHTIMFQYLFVICNSLQGVFIFICHCLTNEEVKSIFLKKYKKMASSSIHTSSMGTASSTLTESTQATTDAKYKGSFNNKHAWKE
uniref:Probable G-protein coupled receptor 133-like n=1 Tax=Saccoglossus kowalevskii TaxID=10224 RepID=A0ABM0MW69_SACKO|nr:PREDICTED: probable G-protein coupled receptor 133-like [Saccoglossus kowalevskii]